MISLLCPTRGRPENIKRLLESALDLARNPSNIELVLYVDDDDIPSIDVAKTLDQAKFVVGSRIVLSQMWNKCYEICAKDYLMHCGDDIIFRTKNWDEMVVSAFNEYMDRILFVYGRDGYSPDHFGTHGFIHNNWVQTVGYFVPPYFSSDMNDTWLNDVSKAIDRKKFLPDLYTEHMHPVNGKAEWDLTHRERLARGERDDVINLYKSKQPERDADAKKLMEFIKNYG